MIYSYFTNEYTLTEDMCAETETSRMDLGIACVFVAAAAILAANLWPSLELIPEIPGLLYEYFSSPSSSDILQLSGFNMALPFVSIPAFLCAAVFLIKSFPRLVGEKRFGEQLQFLPSPKRQINFYDQYVEATGKFHKKLLYNELKRTGETHSLYLLFFTERRILILPKSRFCKGTLAELKIFIRQRRTLKSKIYGILRWLPVILFFLLFLNAFWREY